MASLYAEIGADTKGLDKGLAKSKTGLTSLAKSFTGVVSAAATMSGVVAGVGLVVKNVVDETVEYGRVVDDTARSLGTTTEEASKLIQIADDLRVEVGTLNIAFRTALREGVLPNIDGLKLMAAEYQQLDTPVEKAQYAMQKFGRAGRDMQKFLELAPGQIDEMARSAEKAGLVLSRDAVNATKQYYRELDNLGDSVEGLKIQLGVKLIPELTKSAQFWNEAIGRSQDLRDELDTGKISWYEYIDAILGFNKEAPKFSGHAEAINNILPDIAGGMDDVAGSTEEAAEKLEEMNQASAEAIQALRDLKAEKIEEFFDVDISPEDQAKQLFDVSVFKEAGGESINSFIESVKAGLAEGKITDDQAQEFFGNAIAEAQNLQVELGNIDASEAAESISEDLNIPIGDAKTLLDEAKASADILGSTKFTALVTEFDAIQERKAMLVGAGELDPSNQIVINADPGDVAMQRLTFLEQKLLGMTAKTWYVNVQVNQSGKAADITDDNRATGGPVVAGSPYVVGERGPELFVPGSSGQIVPNGRLGAAMGGDTINIYNYNDATRALTSAMLSERKRERLNASMGY